MPELPEVETVRRGLEPVLTGRRLDEVVRRRADLRFPFPERFAERLTGATVRSVTRRAKYLLAPLDTGEVWVTHLGMTGRFTVDRAAPGRFLHAAPAEGPHEHVTLLTDAGARVGFCDARRFGYMGLIAEAELAEHPWFAALGPEPLGNAFGPQTLAQAFEGRSQNVKVCLLDQKVVAGLGNIYVCEALHRAGISPRTAAGRIAPARLERLAAAVRAVLAEAIEAGGSTLRDYADPTGERGYFQHAFRVYGREHAPCPTPDCRGVVKRAVQAGRSTFWCPQCQR